MPTNCVWLDGISEAVAEKFLARQFSRYGHVTQSVVDRDTCRGLVYFDNVEVAQRAVSEMRGRAISGKRIQVSHCTALQPSVIAYPQGCEPTPSPTCFHSSQTTRPVSYPSVLERRTKERN